MERTYLPVIGFARVLFAAEGLRFRITGSEHFPRTGGAVLVMNHVGYFDFAYAGLAARPAGRYVRFMAKESVFEHKVSGPLMRGMKHIPVDRNAGAASFRQAVNALKAGEIVGVFPEATISRSFELKDFKSGAVRMAQMAGVPLIPMAIWGSQRVWTKDHPKRLGRTGIPIRLNVGAPIPVARRDNAEQVNDVLKERIVALLHEAQGDYPPMTGDELRFQPARLGGTAPSPKEALAMDEADSRQRARS
jgi:1-acyl-sn-glycerol-3-phosphate acyltransferase